MQIGVKNGRAVSSRGLDTHSVNAGKLCPKGLSEHYTIESLDRAYSLDNLVVVAPPIPEPGTFLVGIAVSTFIATRRRLR